MKRYRQHKQLDEFVAFPAEIQANKQARLRRLLSIKEAYADIKQLKCAPKIVRALVREGIEEGISIRSSDRQTLINLMRSLRRFADSPIRDYSTEYYSTCGLDDYQLDQRHSARMQALFLERMIFNQ